MPSQDFVLMAKLVSQVYSRADAAPFREPVNWKEIGLFDYPEIIKKPMDLGQVKAKIERDEYTTVHHAANDVRLVWKNCMQYNADGSDFYNLASALSKRFEEKFKKLLKEAGVSAPSSSKAKKTGEPSLEEKRAFAKSLYKISKEELGKIISDLDSKCPESLSRNQAEDEVHIMVDNISAAVFHDIMAFASTCANDASGRKKKAAASKGSNKKARSS